MALQPEPLEPDTQQLASKLSASLGDFNAEINNLMNAPHLVDSTQALENFVKNIQKLHSYASSAAATELEDLKDAGEIIENILTQPLSIPGAKADISLLEAANNFAAADAMTSDLRKILLSFLQFPGPTEMMIRELEILQEELA